jgi:hypothetical protein
MLITQTGGMRVAPNFGDVPTGLGFFIVIRTQDCRPGLYYDAPAGLSCCRADGLWAVGEAQGPSTRSKFRCAQCALAQDDIRNFLSGTAVLHCVRDRLGVKLGIFPHHQVQGKILFHIAAQGRRIEIQLGHSLDQFAH